MLPARLDFALAMFAQGFRNGNVPRTVLYAIS
jgi:hypothetical protein